MLLWEHVFCLPFDDSIWQRYDAEQVPSRVRQNLAVWIEVFMLESSQGPVIPLQQLDQLEQWQFGGLGEFFKGFLQQLKTETERVRYDDFLLDYPIFHEFLQQIQITDPSILYNKLQNCLTEELLRVQEEQMTSFDSPDTDTIRYNIDRLMFSLEYWKKFTELMHPLAQQLFFQEGYDFVVNQLRRYESRSLIYADTLVTNLETLVNSFAKNGGFLQKLKWSCTSTPPPENMNQILTSVQGWFSGLFTLIRGFTEHSIEFLALCQDPNTALHIEQLKIRVQVLQVTLLQNSLQVQVQPSQVLMQKVWHTFSALFLFQQSFMADQVQREINIDIYIANEAQAEQFFNVTMQILQNPEQAQQQLNMALFASGQLDNAQIIRTSQAWDDNAHPIRIARATRSRTIRTLREKMCFVLHTSFVFQNRNIESWCCTNPFVYTVSPIQRVEACGTIFWDNYFREEGRTPFQVPNHVFWPSMAWALFEYFRKATKSNEENSTSWALTPTNLAYLCQKLVNQQPGENVIVTRDALDQSNQTLGEGGKNAASFWDWFFSATSLAEKHFSSIWNLGLIVGFVERSALEDVHMQGFQPGSFSLRFSEEVIGGISICYVRSNQQGQDGRQVVSLVPFDDDDLSFRNLDQRIYDLDTLQKIVRVDHAGIWNDCLKTDSGIALPVPPSNDPVPNANRPYVPWTYFMQIIQQ